MSEIMSMGFVINVAAQKVIGTILAILVVYLGQLIWKNQKYNGWIVKVIRPNRELGCNRPVGKNKAEEILDDLTTMSVFLKGLVSPYGWLIIDLVTDGFEMGVLTIDKKSKTTTIDLSISGAVKESK